MFLFGVRFGGEDLILSVCLCWWFQHTDTTPNAQSLSRENQRTCPQCREITQVAQADNENLSEEGAVS